MIFVSVGSQLPFDRMIKIVDEWALDQKLEVFAQIGPAKYVPKNIKFSNSIPYDKFNEYLEHCNYFISHAGMGNIISAIDRSKKIMIMPRKAEYGEHRNNHQVATCEKFSKLESIFVFNTIAELRSLTSMDVRNTFDKVDNGLPEADKFSLKIKEKLSSI